MSRRAFLQTSARFSAGVALAGLGLGSLACRSEVDDEDRPTLFVYNWPFSMSNQVLLDFEQREGCRIVHHIYQTGDDSILPHVLANEDHPYDLVVPSGPVLRKLIEEELLEPLDHAPLRLLLERDVLPDYVGLYGDTDNRYSLPFAWGTLGFGVDLAMIPQPEKSWELLWDEAYRNQVAMLDEPLAGFAAALHLLGRSTRTLDLTAMQTARGKLIEQRQAVAPVYTNHVLGRLAAGEFRLAQAYSSDVLQARRLTRTIAYVLPKEGSTRWLTSFAIPKGAKQAELAHRFLTYLMRGDVAARLANELWMPTPNRAAYKYIRPEVLQDPGVYPKAEDLERCEWEWIDAESDENQERMLITVWQQITGRSRG